ncbi:hypothetical protein B0H11DRAFT_2045141 [Mycena galericulata]|nr:hypothetical protein B0H11DRAFT_2045141 [Mycena galericulata]
MPELPEAIISGTLPQFFVNEQPKGSILLLDIQADATQAERALHPAGSAANLGYVYSLESSSTALRGTSGMQTPIYPPLYATSPDEPAVQILQHGLVLIDVETHPRNVLLKFQDNQSRTYWCQIQLLKHSVSQIYNKSDYAEAISVVNSSERFKVGIAFVFQDHVLAFLTLDLLIQFHWAETREKLPARQPDVYLEFPRFLEDLVSWIKKRRQVQSSRAGNALALVRDSTEIFPGAGVYTTAELWHMAGLSPNLTEAEVFDSASRTARLCAAFFHLAKEAHTTLWTFVQRFLVDYVICVREEHRLLYSDRLHVYGKDRAYVTARFNALLTDFKVFCDQHLNDEIWVRRCTSTGPFDVFEPDLIRHALENEDVNLGSLIFGDEVWSDLHSSAGLPPACLSKDNVLARFFRELSVPAEMSATWLNLERYTYLFNDGKSALRAFHPHTILYRASSTDIWAVIPAYPSNSAPIPRPRPPKTSLLPAFPKPSKKSKSRRTAGPSRARPKPKAATAAPRLLPTPMVQCDPSTRERALLSYIIKHTQDYTVGPLDYCGIARRIKGRGKDVILFCKGDPRVPEFYHRRRALAEVTAKLKSKGTEKKGLSGSTIASINKSLAKLPGGANHQKENEKDVASLEGSGRKKRHSADRDLALAADLVLPPRKRQKLCS